jgi:hypothetical protein
VVVVAAACGAVLLVTLPLLVFPRTTATDGPTAGAAVDGDGFLDLLAAALAAAGFFALVAAGFYNTVNISPIAFHSM